VFFLGCVGVVADVDGGRSHVLVASCESTLWLRIYLCTVLHVIVCTRSCRRILSICESLRGFLGIPALL
jgi:hypothetical protein